MKDLTGQRFGMLVALAPTDKRKNRNIVWQFQCDCGNICEKPAVYVLHHNTRSCGCLQKKGLIEYNLECSEQNKISLGTIFGKLTVIEDLGFFKYSQGHNRRKYKCQCECGNIIDVWGNSLKTGNTHSCGCIFSKGEEKITKILLDNNKSFAYDKTIQELIDNTGRRLRFDFIVYNENDNIERIIEFDGRQHYEGMDDGVWKNGSTLEEIQERDKIKNEWCFKHNIPLVRIPYTRLPKLNINDIYGKEFELNA